MTRSEFDAQHQPVHVSGWVWCKGAVMCVSMLVHVSVPMPACGWVGVGGWVPLCVCVQWVVGMVGICCAVAWDRIAILLPCVS